MDAIEVESRLSKFNGFFGIKQDIKQYLKFKIKKRKISEDIQFINKCIKHKIRPNFVQKYVKFSDNSAKEKAAVTKVMEVEKCKHYETISNFDLKTYELHLKLSRNVGQGIWDNLEEKLYKLINFHVSKKRRSLDNKFRNLCQKQKPHTVQLNIRGKNNKVVNPKFRNESTLGKINLADMGNNVVNLSNQKFNIDEIRFLDLGLKTCVDYCSDIEEYIANIEIAIQNLKDEEKCLVRNKCGEILEQMKGEDTNNKTYKKIVKSLNSKPVVYQKADKGNKIVILDTEDYNNKMEVLLTSDEFLEIKEDPTKKCIQTADTTLKNIKVVLTNKDKKYLKANNPTIPKIYGLPKIHKPGNKLRPIISNIGAPCYNLAKWLVKKFQEFPKFNSLSIRNSLDLVEKVKDVAPTDDDCLVSFDVCSLFPSIPKSKVLTVLESWLKDIGKGKDEIEEYVELTKLCINQNFCKFRGKFFEQTKGLAMGNPLSPFLANLFMSKFETHITKAFPWMFLTWWRFVDDIFSIVKKKHIHDALKLLNIQDQNLKFTMELENENYLPFLDLKIYKKNNKIEFGIYRKDTHTDNYIKANSFNPTPHKHAIINSLTHRLVNIPLNEDEYNNEYNHIIHTAIINGFKKSLVDTKIKKFKKKIAIKNISTLETLNDETRYKKFAYHPKFNHKFQKIFNDININLAAQNKFNIKTLIKANSKDKEHTYKKSGIYSLNCKDCDKIYIGQTKRNIEIRKKEHFRNIRLYQTDKSAVAAHVWREGHNMEEEVKLLKELNNYAELTVWEKLYIQKNKSILMNFDIPTEKNLITKYVQPTPEGHRNQSEKAEDGGNILRNMF